MSKPVGYKQPPQHTRWKKGQSGNPTGRVKGRRNLETDLFAELAKKMQIKEGGVARTVTKQQALIIAQVARAISGDGRAANLIFNLQMMLDSVIEMPAPVSLSSEDQALMDAAVAAKARAPRERQRKWLINYRRSMPFFETTSLCSPRSPIESSTPAATSTTTGIWKQFSSDFRGDRRAAEPTDLKHSP